MQNLLKIFLFATPILVRHIESSIGQLEG